MVSKKRLKTEDMIVACSCKCLDKSLTVGGIRQSAEQHYWNVDDSGRVTRFAGVCSARMHKVLHNY